MKQIAITVLFVIFSLFLPSNGKCSGTTSSTLSWQEREGLKRRPITHKWNSALETIALRTNHPSAQEIAHFLRFESAIIIPQDKNGGTSVARIDNYPSNIGIIALLPEDARLNQEWERLERMLKGARAVYLPDIKPVIMISDTPMGEVWRAVNLLHEGIISAEVLEKGNTADPSDSEGWIKERAEMEDSAWGCISEILATLKGPGFENLVEAEAKRLRSRNEISRPRPGSNSQVLNLLFGEPLSPFEEDLRETALWISAVIQVINEKNPEPQKAQEERIRFFREALKNRRL